MAVYITSDIQTYDSLHQFIVWLDARRMDFINVKKWLSSFVMTLLLIPIIFISFLIGIITLRLVLKCFISFIIPKIDLRISDIPLDKDVYVIYRNLYDTISKDLDKLQTIQNAFNKREITPFLTDGLISDFAKIVDSLLNFHVQIEKMLKAMDFPANISVAPFNAVSEDELWNNRNHAYQYLM